MGKKKRQEQKKGFDVYVSFAESVGSNVDRANNMINNVVLLGKYSVSRQGRIKREYEDEAMREGTPLYEGAPVYYDHDVEGQVKGKVRSSKKLAGNVDKAWFSESEKKIRGNVEILKCEQRVFDIAEQMPDKAGFSHHIGGKFIMKGGVQNVTKIGLVKSVDIVTEAGTTKNFFESVNDEEYENFLVEEKEDMKIEDMTLEELQESRPDLVKKIQAKDADKATIDELNGKLKTLEESVKTKETEIDEFKAKEKLAEKATLIEQKLEDAKLPEILVTKQFKSDLIESKDMESVDKMIAERKQIAEKMTGEKTVYSKPKSGITESKEEEQTRKGKDMTDDEIVEQLTAD